MKLRKGSMHIVLLSALILSMQATTVSCSRNGSLEQALKQACGNRNELEKVLDHYANEPEKLHAAEWLIENMPGHAAVCGEAVSAFSDSIASRAMTKAEADSLWKEISRKLPRPEKCHDITSVSSDFLIDNIDTAFKTWRESPWRDSIGYDMFLRHILPYRVESEPLLNGWRDSLRMTFAPLLKGVSDPREAFTIIRKEIFSREKTKAFECPHLMHVAAYRNYFSTVCLERCIYL
ncbi:MAG: hypothetical protein K2F94_08805, partial [Muribaculaceae bacterium]|nr:hypothetical protein [Muribaculaceae bacterium]